MNQSATKQAYQKTDGLVDQSPQHDYVTMYVNDQLFGIPVSKVRDILTFDAITPIPLAAKEIDGLLNLRGRIVTAINLRKRLNMEASTSDVCENMHVVISVGSELYSLVVDKVGEVLSLSTSLYETTPITLEESWRNVAGGIYRLPERIIVILDIDKLFHLS